MNALPHLRPLSAMVPSDQEDDFSLSKTQKCIGDVRMVECIQEPTESARKQTIRADEAPQT
jgi:hypothetical protein